MCSYSILNVTINIVINQKSHTSMIDRTRNNILVSEQLLSADKFAVDQYHNPYLTKLTMKIHPQLSLINKYQPRFFNPIFDHNLISIRQSLPVYKSSKLLVCLNWRQDMRNAYNLTHLGSNISYKLDGGYKLKWKFMMGISFLNDIELKKQIKVKDSLLELHSSYTGFKEDGNSIYHTVGVGARYKDLGIGIRQKIDGNLVIKADYTKLIRNGLYFQLKSDSIADCMEQTIFEVGVGYFWRQGISMWLKSVLEPNNAQKQISNMGVQIQAKMKKDTFLASVEYRENKSIIYLGYKCPSFNFIFPVFGIESPVPILLALGVYVYGYFHRQKQIKAEKKEKKIEDRSQQLKLITDKANQLYNREQSQNGLLIQQVYIGPQRILSEFLEEANRVVSHLNKQEYKINVFDSTISFRFYVQKGQLSLPRGSKLSLLGCFYHNDESIQIYIRYVKGGIKYERMFEEDDAILL